MSQWYFFNKTKKQKFGGVPYKELIGSCVWSTGMILICTDENSDDSCKTDLNINMWPINSGKSKEWVMDVFAKWSGDAVSIGKPTSEDDFADITDSVTLAALTVCIMTPDNRHLIPQTVHNKQVLRTIIPELGLVHDDLLQYERNIVEIKELNELKRKVSNMESTKYPSAKMGRWQQTHV